MPSIQLSDIQRAILATACRREGHLVLPLTVPLKGGAVGIVLTSLLRKGVIETAPAGEHDVVWCTGENGEALTLRAAPLAFHALGIEMAGGAESGEASAGEPAGEGATAPTMEEATLTDIVAAASTTRTGSKQAALIAMLRRSEGASLEEIVAATGWQAHTVRGAISGALKKRLGLTVTSERVEGRGRVYRITN